MKQPALLIACGAVVVGVGLGSWLPWEYAVFAAVMAGLVGALLRFPVLLVLPAILLGIWRIGQAPLTPPSDDISALANQTVTGTGAVISYPEPGSGRQRAVVEVEAHGRHGKALLYTDPYPTLKPGDTLKLKGKVKLPEALDGFDYPKYLAKDGIHAIMYRPKLTVTGHETRWSGALYPLRQAFLEKLAATFHEPAASFIAAILIGDRTGIPDAVVDDFRRTGTIHVMALSGYNISILVAALVMIVGRGRFAVWLVFLSILAFVVFVGPSASVVRAALMGSLLLLAQVFGRPQEAMLGCVVAGALMLMFQPWALRYDLGFDLSFLATLGILLFEPGVTARLVKLPSAVRDIVSPTIAASLPTMPLIAASFGTVSLIAPLANLLVVPVIPWLMLGGFVATLSAFIAEPLGRVVGTMVQATADLVLGTVEWMGGYAFASIDLGGWQLLFIAASLAVCGWCAVWLRVAPAVSGRPDGQCERTSAGADHA